MVSQLIWKMCVCGELRENGCFAVPRESGMAVGLQVSTRTIIYTLGSGMKHDTHT